MKGKILVVDDEREILKILEEFLIRQGFEVITASDGEKAMGVICSNFKVDVMILDLKMPKLNGFEVLEELSRIKYKIPVIILKGSVGEGEDSQRLLELGYSDNDFLDKPIDLYLLLDKIKTRLPHPVD